MVKVSRLLGFSIAMCFALLLSYQTQAQDAAAPPSLGTNTKGKPAVAETAPAAKQTAKPEASETLVPSAKATEYRYSSGQVYRIELDNTVGGKQYIEETDSDGQLLGNKNSDLEETTNLPKWKLGSW
jgi:hypothetical protein